MKKISVSHDDTTIEIQLSENAAEYGGFDLRALLTKIERETIAVYFAKLKIKNRVAKLLGFNRTTLIEKMKKYGFEIKRRDDADSGL